MNTPIKMDGKATLAQIKQELKEKVAGIPRTPGLATVLVGSDPGSQVYVNMKHKDCHDVGIASIRVELPEDSSTADVLDAVGKLNNDPECSGSIVQLPSRVTLIQQPCWKRSILIRMWTGCIP